MYFSLHFLKAYQRGSTVFLNLNDVELFSLLKKIPVHIRGRGILFISFFKLCTVFSKTAGPTAEASIDSLARIIEMSVEISLNIIAAFCHTIVKVIQAINGCGIQ